MTLLHYLLFILFILPSCLKNPCWSHLPCPGVELSTHHGANSLADFREFSFRELACHPANDAATGSDQPMGQKETLLRQSTGEKI
jgi:hypothetical protein